MMVMTYASMFSVTLLLHTVSTMVLLRSNQTYPELTQAFYPGKSMVPAE